MAIESELPELWSLRQRILHWATVLVLSGALLIGFFEMAPGLATMVWLPTHVTLGFVLLILVVARLVSRPFERRRCQTASALRSVALGVHSAIYVVLLSVLVSGWIAYRPMPLMPPVKVAGLFPLAPFSVGWLPPMPYRDLHYWLTWVLVCLVVIHVAAAILHAIRRDGVVSAMTYRAKPPKR